MADEQEPIDAADLAAFREVLRHIAREEIRHMVAVFGIALAGEVERRMAEIAAALQHDSTPPPPTSATLQ